VAGLAFEREARLMAAARPGMRVKVTGFVAGKSRDSKQLVLHATNIEFVEGV
jgi:primosomal replication protein N